MLLANDFPKETIIAIIIFYKDMKVIVCSCNSDSDYIDIVSGVLQGIIFEPFLFILGQDYVQ